MFERALSRMKLNGLLGQNNTEDGTTYEITGGSLSDDAGPICIGVVEGPLRAEIARTYLEQAGITVHLQGEALGVVYGFTSGPLGAVRVLVPATQAEEAAQIFAELDFSDAAEDR